MSSDEGYVCVRKQAHVAHQKDLPQREGHQKKERRREERDREHRTERERRRQEESGDAGRDQIEKKEREKKGRLKDDSEEKRTDKERRERHGDRKPSEQKEERGKGKTVLIVGHSNTTPVFANKILGKKMYENMSDNDNASLFIVTISADDKTSKIEKID